MPIYMQHEQAPPPDLSDVTSKMQAVTEALQADGLPVRVKGAGVLISTVVTVGTSASQIVSANPKRHKVTIQTPVTLYVGAAGVSAENGIEIPGGSSAEMDISAGLFAVASSAGSTVRVLEEVHQ